MKIACIGGGPAGLYLGILVKRRAPEHEVVVYERNRPSDTFGFGVVFSDATLGHLAAADPESHAQITSKFARWDDIEVHAGGEVLRSTGHGFCGLERKTLLHILQARAAEVGVRVEFEHEVRSLDDVAGADLVVACDGVASWVRDVLAEQFKPAVDVRPNKFVWLGCTVPYRAFTFLFEEAPEGLYRVHAYPFRDDTSTFIVECTQETWRAAGFESADEDATIARLEQVFAKHLDGNKLIKNRSIWRSFPTVRCGTWHATYERTPVVLLGDAAHTAHFSIGSGTKLAMEDSIVLRDQILGARDVPAGLAAYEAARRPEVEALQAAAQASLEWFEGTERYMGMTPVQMTYSLMTRSLRVSHASVGRRDPHLARGVERLLAASVGIVAEPSPVPTALPFKLGDRRVANRIVVAPGVDAAAGIDDLLVELGAPAAAGVGMVATPVIGAAQLSTDDAAVAWARVVDYVHGKRGLVAARLAFGELAQVVPAVQRAAYAGFDLVVLSADNPHAVELLPAFLIEARKAWRAGGWLGAAVDDRPRTRLVVVGHAAQLVRAGADMLWVSSAGDPALTGARVPAAPIADRLRNELGVPVALYAADALLADLDATVAAGRADLAVVSRVPR